MAKHTIDLSIESENRIEIMKEKAEGTFADVVANAIQIYEYAMNCGDPNIKFVYQKDGINYVERIFK